MSKGRKHKQYLARAQAMGGSTTVPAGDTIAVLVELSQRMSFSAIAKELGTSHNYVTKVMRGEIRRIQPSRHAEIMAMRNFEPTDTSHVNPTPAVRRLRALHAMGYSFARLEREIGCYSLGAIKDAVYDRTPVMEAQHVIAIRETYKRLSMSLPVGATISDRSGITRARNTARAHGWPPPLAWDDIDDPTEHPRDWHYTAASRAEQFAELYDRGDGLADMCRSLHLSEKSLEKWCQRNGRAGDFTTLRDRDRGYVGQRNQYSEEAS